MLSFHPLLLSVPLSCQGLAQLSDSHRSSEGRRSRPASSLAYVGSKKGHRKTCTRSQVGGLRIDTARSSVSSRSSVGNSEGYPRSKGSTRPQTAMNVGEKATLCCLPCTPQDAPCTLERYLCRGGRRHRLIGMRRPTPTSKASKTVPSPRPEASARTWRPHGSSPPGTRER